MPSKRIKNHSETKKTMNCSKMNLHMYIIMLFGLHFSDKQSLAQSSMLTFLIILHSADIV